ncbi:MAG: hypothetical protein RI885_1494, partial [Actinomycetota bacterium]
MPSPARPTRVCWVTQPIYLRSGSTSILLDLGSDDPRIVHWGADLGEVPPDPGVVVPPVAHSAFDVPVQPSVLPQASRGWRGRAGLRGHREGTAFSPRLSLVEVAAVDPAHCTLLLRDEACGLEVRIEYTLDAHGMLEVDQTVINTGSSAYSIEGMTIQVPLPAQATEALDLTGRWSGERHPQRHVIQQGTWVRSGRHGRTGHDATLAMVAGTPGFASRTGEVWALHLGWSGNHESFIDALPSGDVMVGVGELLEPGEILLAAGESYRSPRAFCVYSPHGLDGVGDVFHEWMRSRPGHPATPRPVILNTWEAVYFEHDLPTLLELADAAADLGVERFVLDDGWFLGRRHDRAGLGDWYVDDTVWPDGLGPLIEHVHARGMQFGLWVEPEMINEDSALAREHPEWISGPADRTPLGWRSQQVLDLAEPEAWRHVFERLDSILHDNRIDYLKWDQNRDHLEAGHGGRASTHDQTIALYGLLDALREAHPSVEIESCSSGGGRVDLGILARTDRVWASDTNDALERQIIQRWTTLVVPPELVGAHIGPERSHTTGRTHDLAFRAITAMFGHLGLEWDVRTLDEGDRERLRGFIDYYKTRRALIHSGRLVHVDHPDPATTAYGVVDRSGDAALFVVATLASSAV